MGDDRTLDKQIENDGEPYNGLCDGFVLKSIPCNAPGYEGRPAGKSRVDLWIGSSREAEEYMLKHTDKYGCGMAIYYMSEKPKQATIERLVNWGQKYAEAKKEVADLMKHAARECVSAALERVRKKKSIKCKGPCQMNWPSPFVEQLITDKGLCPYRTCRQSYEVEIKSAKLKQAQRRLESAKAGLSKVYDAITAAGIEHGCIGAGWGSC